MKQFKNVKTIDPALLIQEVQKRPLLYDNKFFVASTDVRRKTWFELADLFIENWKNLSQTEKEVISRELQSKWKALRDSFRRTVRLEERDRKNGILNSRRSKYYYYEQLSFLKDHCGPKRHDTNSDENGEDIYENGDDTNMEYVKPDLIFLSSQSVDDVPDTSEVGGRNELSAEEHSIKITNIRIANVLEELAALRKQEMGDDIMGNKRFLLSLLPFMENLSNEDNLKVRVQFMTMLQAYNRK